MRSPKRLDSGRWQVRFRHGISPKTGKPVEASESFDTKREAEEFAKALDLLGPVEALKRLYDGEQASLAPTLDQIAADHIAHMEGAGKAHRIKSQRLWDRTWGPRIGSLRADQVTRDDLIRALDDLAHNGRSPGRGYSPKSLYNQRGLLFGVLERCVDTGIITRHPGKKLRLPQVTVALDMDDDDDPAEMVCLTPGEWEVLFDAMTPHYRPLVRFLTGTGCRWGEAVALRVSDVDLAAQTVRIRRALKWSPDGQHVIGQPKTEKSRRTIALPSEVTADLASLLAGKASRDLVFTAPRGGMIAHRTFWADHWRPALWRAQHCPDHTEEGCRCGTAHPERCKVHETSPAPCGCPGTLRQSPRIHDLRHTHASWMLAYGVPIHVLQARLGHESIQTTVDTYSHLLPDAQLMAAESASLAFRGVTPLVGPRGLDGWRDFQPNSRAVVAYRTTVVAQ